jgi:hypothetical protein
VITHTYGWLYERKNVRFLSKSIRVCRIKNGHGNRLRGV